MASYVGELFVTLKYGAATAALILIRDTAATHFGSSSEVKSACLLALHQIASEALQEVEAKDSGNGVMNGTRPPPR